ncbi:hypothetical protein LCGC14_0774310 [marine sediment metagenome]|uniref:Restriction endonuclease type IV Mrr domain-containing protein n=1 Tax=marine sediment metagenome TaxID=412755 RepID=A0A0F9T4F3_9ZZZZ
MPNYRYIKGRAKEQLIVRQAKAQGCLSFRSAGSKSQIDVFILNPETKEITLVQSKSDKIPDAEIKRILTKLLQYEGTYEVSAEVR